MPLALQYFPEYPLLFLVSLQTGKTRDVTALQFSSVYLICKELAEHILKIKSVYLQNGMSDIKYSNRPKGFWTLTLLST